MNILVFWFYKASVFEYGDLVTVLRESDSNKDDCTIEAIAIELGTYSYFL